MPKNGLKYYVYRADLRNDESEIPGPDGRKRPEFARQEAEAHTVQRWNRTQSWLAGIAGCLLALAAWVPVGSALADQATSIELNGVIVGERSQSALINGRILRVGDFIGGVEIAGIDHDGIRVRTNDQQAVVNIGSSRSINQLDWRPLQPPPNENSEPQIKPTVFAAVNPPVGSETGSASIPVVEPSRQHEVLVGETLSEIAESFIEPGIRRQQMMVAIFKNNPHAFHGNINRMRSGVVLKIPSAESLQRVSPRFAMADVMQQTNQWRSEWPHKIRQPQPAALETYGPVESGESLSRIAYSLLPSGGDALALMTEIYERNPHAFGDSMDMLRVGVVLNLPEKFRFDRGSPSPATAVAQATTLPDTLPSH